MSEGEENEKRIFILLIITVVGGAIMTVFFFKKNKYKDLRAYTERLLKIEWNDCIESATGSVKTIYREEVAHVKLEVRTGYEEEALSILKNKFGKSLERYIIPPRGGHEFIEEVKSGNIQYVDKIVMEGKRIKTRNIEIYAIYNEKGQMFIYIMG